MRERDWEQARTPEGTLVEKPRLTARAVEGRGHALISGDLDAAIAALAPGASLIGLYALAPEGPHALRIARDRALLVTPAPPGAADGWRDGWCVTTVDEGWAALDVEGTDAPLTLMQGASVDLAAGSPSAALRFGGLACLLARTNAGFRLHVERPWLEALLTWLDDA